MPFCSGWDICGYRDIVAGKGWGSYGVEFLSPKRSLQCGIANSFTSVRRNCKFRRAGCVGGAVMGFASSFMWGAVGGIAASLLTTCFR